MMTTPEPDPIRVRAEQIKAVREQADERQKHCRHGWVEDECLGIIYLTPLAVSSNILGMETTHRACKTCPDRSVHRLPVVPDLSGRTLRRPEPHEPGKRPDR